MADDALYQRVAALWAPHRQARARISYNVGHTDAHTLFFMGGPEVVLKLQPTIRRVLDPHKVVTQLYWGWNDTVLQLDLLEKADEAIASLALTGDALEFKLALSKLHSRHDDLIQRPWQTCWGNSLALDTETGVIYHQDEPVADLQPGHLLNQDVVKAWLTASIHLRALHRCFTHKLAELRQLAQKHPV